MWLRKRVFPVEGEAVYGSCCPAVVEILEELHCECYGHGQDEEDLQPGSARKNIKRVPQRFAGPFIG